MQHAVEGVVQLLPAPPSHCTASAVPGPAVSARDRADGIGGGRKEAPRLRAQGLKVLPISVQQ